MTQGAPLLRTRGLCCGYGQRAVLRGVDLEVGEGETLCLIGPNGAGKTTLFKTILGFLPRIEGAIFIEGEEAGEWTRRRFARTVAYVPQAAASAFGFTVQEMVLMGRTPSLEGFASPGKEDGEIADAVIESLGLSALAQRECTSLSGGEEQMVLIARALAQQPRLLMMDEPCASLDMGKQLAVLEQIDRLAGEGLGIVVTTHDPAHALALGGKVACAGADGKVECVDAAQLEDGERLSALYGVQVGVGTVASPAGLSGWACAPLFAGRRRAQKAADGREAARRG